MSVPPKEIDIEIEIGKFFKISLEMLCIAGTDGYFKVLNPVWEKVLGYTQEELKAQPFVDFVHPDDVQGTLDEVTKLSEGALTINFINRYKDKSGKYRWLNWNCSPDPASGMLYASAREITAEKEFQMELEKSKEQLAKYAADLERSNESLKNFAYIVSHDLKSPLRAIHNLATWIQEDLGDKLDGENAENFEMLKSRVSRMNSLIEGILAYSRVGKVKMEWVPVDLNLIVGEVVDLLAPPPAFEIIVQENLPTVLAESTRLQQVFQNLISNALKHHDKDAGKIEVTCIQAGDHYRFCIADDGPGIPEDAMVQIFEIFMTTQGKGSTGIGLALVKKIVEELGGVIWVESEEGKGSKFFFTLPVKPESP